MYFEGLNVVSIIFCLKGIRDHKIESGLFDKTSICLHIFCFPLVEDLLKGQKSAPQSEILQLF